MKTYGYIHLHRSLLTWPYHNNPSMLTVWMHLLMLAEYEDCEYEGNTIHRGELLVSQQWLAEFVGVSDKQLRLCLQKLEDGKEITKKRACGKTLITILKYNDYQVLTNNIPTATANKMPTVSPEKGQQKDNMEINKTNNKNLSDREMQKPETSGTSGISGKPGTPGISGISGTPGKPGTPGNSGASDRSTFTRQLVSTEFWKSKCCRDYNISPTLINRHIVAFHEQLLRENPNKSWLSFEDFCRHFHSWLRFQTPESIKRYTTLAQKRYQHNIALRVEAERRAKMWEEIEASKRNAISYEEHLRRQKSPG